MRVSLVNGVIRPAIKSGMLNTRAPAVFLRTWSKALETGEMSSPGTVLFVRLLIKAVKRAAFIMISCKMLIIDVKIKIFRIL